MFHCMLHYVAGRQRKHAMSCLELARKRISGHGFGYPVVASKQGCIVLQKGFYCFDALFSLEVYVPNAFTPKILLASKHSALHFSALSKELDTEYPDSNEGSAFSTVQE